MDYFFKKIAVPAAIFYFSLTSSCSKPCLEWELEKTVSDIPCYHSAKIHLSSCDKFGGIEVECRSSILGIEMFLNVYALTFPRSEENPSQTLVYISIDGEQQIARATLFEGEQRLHLPQDATQAIINALLEKSSVHLRVGRYQTDVKPLNFEKVFRACIN